MAGRDKPVAVRLERGVALPAAIESAAERTGLEFCDVGAFGELEWIELRVAGADVARRLEGPLDLLQLSGRLRRAGEVVLADYVCTVSRATDSGIELLGGKLVAAQAEFVEVVLFGLEAAELEGAEIERRTAAEPRAQPAPEPAGPVSGRWAEALAESKRQQRRARERGYDWDSDEEELRPSRGDVVLHRQFGRCGVVRVDDEHISLKKPDGRVVQLGLAVLEFTAAGDEDGKPVYEVAVRKG